MLRRNRRNRSSLFFAAMSAMLPYATVPAAAFHFEGEENGGAGGSGDGGGAGGGSGGAGDGGAGGGGTRKPKVYTETEFVPVAKARDKAKGAFKALLRRLGVDPEDVTIVETGDDENPYAVEGIDDIADLVAEKTKDGGGDKDAKRKLEDEKRKRILRPVEKKLEAEKAKSTALIDWIRKNAIVAPIRSACVAEKIVDDDGGLFEDVVEILSKRYRVDVSIDPDDLDAGARVDLVTIDENGDPHETPKTAREMVADLAKRKPKYRQSDFRPGPGAGGHTANGQRRQASGGVSTPSKSASMAKAVAAHYGVRPEEIGIEKD